MGARPQIVFCCELELRRLAHLRAREVRLPLLDGTRARGFTEQVHPLVVHVLDRLPDRRVARLVARVVLCELERGGGRRGLVSGDWRHRVRRVRRSGVVRRVAEARAPAVSEVYKLISYQWQKSLLTTKNVSSSAQYFASAAETASRELAGGWPTSRGTSLRSSRLRVVSYCDTVLALRTP